LLGSIPRETNSTESSHDINSKKGNTTMLIATPDEILQKGLEMGGFNHW
jgi:hypothetical protein